MVLQNLNIRGKAMIKWKLKRVIKRIKRMEACFDTLLTAAEKDPSKIDKKQLRTLTDYYDGGQWRQDFEFDERGYLPHDLKRGVLSQDGVYNFLAGFNSKDAD